MSIDYTDYQDIDHPRTIARFIIGALVVALAFTLAAAQPPRVSEPAATIRGVSDRCDSSACLSWKQVITASEASAMKRRLGHALLVDIHAQAEAKAALAIGTDVHAPFMEPVSASGMEFRLDFGNNVDEALRAAHMLHDEPVILFAPSTERAVLAALLLQERGYTRVFVVRA